MGLFVVKIKRKRLQIKCVPKNFGARMVRLGADIVAHSRDKLYNDFRKRLKKSEETDTKYKNK